MYNLQTDRVELIPAALSDWVAGPSVVVEGTVGSDEKSFARRSSVILSSSCAAASSSTIGLCV